MSKSVGTAETGKVETDLNSVATLIRKNAQQYIVMLFLLVILLLMAIFKPIFFNPSNVANIMRQISINMVLAMGLSFVILTGGIDLSVGALVALEGVLCALAMKDGIPIPTAILLALITGLICGTASGLVIVGFNIPPFIATLSMMQVARGAAYIVTDANPVTSFDDAFLAISTGRIGPILYYPTIIMAFTVLITAFLLKHTKWGRYIYAVGGNIEAARVSGINTKSVIVKVYAYSGLMSAIAAILLIARVNAAQPQFGNGYELDAIASCVIGGISLSGGIGNIRGAVLGAVLIGIISNCMNLLGINSYWQMVAKGLIIVLAVVIDKTVNEKKQ